MFELILRMSYLALREDLSVHMLLVASLQSVMFAESDERQDCEDSYCIEKVWAYFSK